MLELFLLDSFSVIIHAKENYPVENDPNQTKQKQQNNTVQGLYN